MNSEKRLILAITLSVLIMLGYQTYMRQFQKPYHNRITSEPQLAPVAQEAKTEQTLSTTMGESAAQRKQATLKPGTETIIDTSLYQITLSDNEAAIKEVCLKNYKDKAGNMLAIKSSTPGVPCALSFEDTAGSSGDRQWRVLRKADDEITYISEGRTQVVTKRFKFHKTKHIIELELTIQNISSTPQIIEYKITGSPAMALTNSLDSRYTGADAKVADLVTRRKPASKSVQGGEVIQGKAEWASAISRYFSFAIKPEQEHQAAFIESADKKNIWSGLIMGPVTLEPNKTITRDYLLYAGPNKADQLSFIGITGGEVISYGKLGSIANIMFKALGLFYKTTGNYGVAIILLALAISAVLFPLTRKSLRSMKEMQKIQPETERIRKEYSDNPQKLNKEIMELYKKHKINPLSGCLPMLLQLPIFLALYQVLLRSVELKGASFLWIKDLSEPDAAFTLPYTLPILGSHINILPILMAAAMALQQKISQPGASASEQQKMMSTIMPILMAVIFYNLPSGLVLYWLTNTLFMLLLQEVVLKSRVAA